MRSTRMSTWAIRAGQDGGVHLGPVAQLGIGLGAMEPIRTVRQAAHDRNFPGGAAFRFWNLQTFASAMKAVILSKTYHPQENHAGKSRRKSAGRTKRQTRPVAETDQPAPLRRPVPALGARADTRLPLRALAPGAANRRWADVVVAYSPEYLRFRSDPIMLRQIAERTGGRILTGQEKAAGLVRHSARSPRKTSKSIVDLLLILLACLIPLDVGVRRVQLDWSVIRGWFGAGRKNGIHRNVGRVIAPQGKSARDYRGGPQDSAGHCATGPGATGAAIRTCRKICLLRKPRRSKNPRRPPPGDCWR